jgi:hypothetical protein
MQHEQLVAEQYDLFAGAPAAHYSETAPLRTNYPSHSLNQSLGR